MVDAQAFDRIVSNLVANALRHGAPPILVSARGSNGELWVTIEDRGRGVADEFVGSLFERFTRGATDASEGAGLGLSIAQSYARAHGGTLTYEPAEPTGREVPRRPADRPVDTPRMTHDAVETDPVAALTPATFDDAQRRVAPVVHRTPVLSSASLSRETGFRVLLKAELFQRTGSYKIRGPSNKLPQLSAEQQRAGVICSSAGNHAQGVALAARRASGFPRSWRWRRTRRRRRSPRRRPTAPRSSCTGASGTRRTPRRSGSPPSAASR